MAFLFWPIQSIGLSKKKGTTHRKQSVEREQSRSKTKTNKGLTTLLIIASNFGVPPNFLLLISKISSPMSNRICVLFIFFSLICNSIFADHTPYEIDFDQLKQEVEELDCIVEPKYNSVVKAYLNRYLKTGRVYSARMIGRTDIYFPIFEAYLKAENLPEDLKYLPVVESALNPKGTSRVGAQGLWQFMPTTAPEFGMKVSSEVDERMDTNLATMGALKYLKKSYERFQSWELALASYNAGPGRVNRAMKRARSTKFSRVKRYLPRETQNYIPAFIAATFLMKNYEKYELAPYKQDLDLVLTETVVLTEQMNFELIKRITGLDQSIIKRLNPSYINEVIPYKKGGSFLIIPSRVAKAINDYQKVNYYKDQQKTISGLPVEILNKELSQNEKYFRYQLKLKESYPTEALADLLGISSHILYSWNPDLNQLDTLQKEIEFQTFKPAKYLQYNDAMWSAIDRLPTLSPKVYCEKPFYIAAIKDLGTLKVGKNNTIMFQPNRTVRIKTLLDNYKSWNRSFILRKNKLKLEDLIHPSDMIRIQ